MLISRPPLYNKIPFSEPPHVQINAIFETTYTTKAQFLDPPIQRYVIFGIALYNKMAFSRPLYTTKFPVLNPLYRNGQKLNPLYKK